MGFNSAFKGLIRVPPPKKKRNGEGVDLCGSGQDQRALVNKAVKTSG